MLWTQTCSKYLRIIKTRKVMNLWPLHLGGFNIYVTPKFWELVSLLSTTSAMSSGAETHFSVHWYQLCFKGYMFTLSGFTGYSFYQWVQKCCSIIPRLKKCHWISLRRPRHVLGICVGNTRDVLHQPHRWVRRWCPVLSLPHLHNDVFLKNLLPLFFFLSFTVLSRCLCSIGQFWMGYIFRF